MSTKRNKTKSYEDAIYNVSYACRTGNVCHLPREFSRHSCEVLLLQVLYCEFQLKSFCIVDTVVFQCTNRKVSIKSNNLCFTMSDKKQISLLPTQTIKLISATQIATSVCNIVKELVENSLDAGSTIIRVKLENSGLDKIEVIDNGCGISKADIYVAALPHYTSKITQHEDLECLLTYGFRGEALSAICSVSKVSITTKTSEDPVAATYTMDYNGKVVNSKPSHFNQGSWVVISQLFHNVPVRKQFYQSTKRKKDELSNVEDLLYAFGLIHPDLHLSLHHNRSLVWQKNRMPNLKGNISQILGHSIFYNMEYIAENITDHEVIIYMFLPKRNAPVDVCFRHRPDRCFTFINKRPVIFKEVEKTMKEVYERAHEIGNKSLYPIYVLVLEVPPCEIDVNLEPNKTKVLLKCQAEIIEFLRNRVDKLLQCDEIQLSLESSSDDCLQDINVPKNPVSESVSNEDEPEEPDVTAKSITSVEDSGTPYIESEFCGFLEPFSKAKEDTEVVQVVKHRSNPVSISSSDWSKGVARNEEGDIVHPVQILRGEPHFAKRISDEEKEGNISKRAKLVESQEALRIVGPTFEKLETVNGQVKTSPGDAFHEYCKEMRPELLSQNPKTTLMELSAHLSQGWKNLSQNDRKRYQERAQSIQQRYRQRSVIDKNRQGPAGGSTLDRFLFSKTSDGKDSNFSSSNHGNCTGMAKSSVCRVNFSVGALRSSLRNPSPFQRGWSCIGKFTEFGQWFCCHGKDIFAVNFQRLYEVVIFHRLMKSHRVPSKLVPNSFTLEYSMLNECVWTVLTKLSAHVETAGSRVLDDDRAVLNGFGIRLIIEGTGMKPRIQVFKVPGCVSLLEMNDIVLFLSQLGNPHNSIESCRPAGVKQFFRCEAARLAAERYLEPDENELRTLLDEWWKANDGDVCIHGKPVTQKIGSVHSNV